MVYFDKEYCRFFKELEKNNTKAWFDKNRKRYEDSVKVPFKKLVLDLVQELQLLYPHTDLSDKFSIMRINRDTRFGTDKTPYKIQMGGMIMPGGKKNKTLPGFYIQANHKDVRVYSGAHMLEKDQLNAIRIHIRERLDEFNSLINNLEFVETYGKINGDKHKRLPLEFREIETIQPLIANKDFYWFFKLPSKKLTSNDLVEELVTKYIVALPINRFFERALTQNKKTAIPQ